MAATCLPRCLRASARSQRAGLPNKGKVVRKGSGKRTSYAREIQAAVVRVLMSNTRHLGSVWLRSGTRDGAIPLCVWFASMRMEQFQGANIRPRFGMSRFREIERTELSHFDGVASR